MEQKALIDELRKLILPVLEELDIELVEFRFMRQSERFLLRLLVDKKNDRINIDECAELNKKIGGLLDTQDIIKNKYILEVSSPGLDRPLASEADFARCINRKVRIFLNEPISQYLELEGIIEKTGSDSVYIKIKGEIIEIPLTRISKAKQII